MVPDLLAGYSFLSAVTAKDGPMGLPQMIGKTMERMTGLKFTFDAGPSGFPGRLRMQWTGGPTIARGLGEYAGNLFGNPDTYIAALAAVGPSFIRGYSPIAAPSKLGGIISLFEEIGVKSLVAIVAGTVFDPPPVSTNTYAPRDNPRGQQRGLGGGRKQMEYSSKPGGSSAHRFGVSTYREIHPMVSLGAYR